MMMNRRVWCPDAWLPYWSAVAGLLLLTAHGLDAQSSHRLPAHGPRNGYLLINGSNNFVPDYARFIRMAGGDTARIVMIPTSVAIPPGTTHEQLQKKYCDDPHTFAGTSCTVLHTTDRAVANSEAFVKPLEHATGVWIEPPEGGRQWRLVDAYLGTRTVKELFKVLDRGGVIGGGSAGATIQGSFLVRGSSHPDDNTIMMAPGHEKGFGFFTNTAIDQHVDVRHRENDLAPVIRAHPELLGLGLDQETSITVHGDELVDNGPGRVAVWDGRDHDGKRYFYLYPGDRLNTVTAEPIRARR